MIRSLIQSGLITAAAAVAVPAGAVVLVPSVYTALPGTTSTAEPQLAGTVVEDRTQSFSYLASGVESAPAPVTGTVESRVIKAVDGSFDFYWRITNDASSAHAITNFDLGSFFAPTYRANWRQDGPAGVAPVDAIFRPEEPGRVSFSFSFIEPECSSICFEQGRLPRGQSTRFFFLDTDAVRYASSALFFLDSGDGRKGDPRTSGSSGGYATFAPAPIPEPSTWALMLIGLGILAWRRAAAGALPKWQPSSRRKPGSTRDRSSA